MTTYTEKDFANARFAVHPDPETVNARYAARMSRDPEFPWLLDGVLGNGDEHMARDGWVPVVESATHERTIAELRYDLTVARKELAGLRKENDRLDRILQAPLLLKDLEVAWEEAEVAWEAAEVPTDENPIREGDTVIVRNPDPEEFSVFTWPGYGYTPDEETRILSRAPREPWRDLADDLSDRSALMGEGIIEAAAKALHLAGWRKTGGDDDE